MIADLKNDAFLKFCVHCILWSDNRSLPSLQLYIQKKSGTFDASSRSWFSPSWKFFANSLYTFGL